MHVQPHFQASCHKEELPLLQVQARAVSLQLPLAVSERICLLHRLQWPEQTTFTTPCTLRTQLPLRLSALPVLHRCGPATSR